MNDFEFNPLILDPTLPANNSFGFSLSASDYFYFSGNLTEEGDLFVVGAPNVDRVYGYLFNPTVTSNWTTIAELKGAAGTHFGYSVACYDNFIIVGAPAANGNAGTVHTYKKISSGGFTLMQSVCIMNNYIPCIHINIYLYILFILIYFVYSMNCRLCLLDPQLAITSERVLVLTD